MIATERTRSLTGCATCRARHLKCDEQRPRCFACRSLGVQCGGYQNRIMFMTDPVAGPDTSRRPLLTDTERKQMSEVIVLSTTAKSIPNILSEIELELEDQDSVANPTDLQLQRGPFGAFRVSPKPTGLSDTAADQLLYSGPATDLEPLDIPALNETLLDFDLGIEELDMIDPLPELPLDNHPPDATTCWPGNLDTSLELAQNAQDSDLPRVNTVSPLRPPPSSFSIKGLPMDEITFLMSRYKDSVIPLLSPVKRVKTLWHVIFLTGGLNTLAALTLKTNPGPASLAELFALLSITAMSLRGPLQNSEWTRWNEKGLEYLMTSEKLLQAALGNAFMPFKEAKYKTILAAILAVAQASTFAGTWEHTEMHLLNAERFIRLKGLSKKDKSRRVRFLHHCYGYQRIFYESTHVLPDCTQRRKCRAKIQQAGVSVPGEDNVAFRLRQWPLDLDQKMQEPKPRESGENDLHLSMPGTWELSYYNNIYEIPESFLCLLSQVIRLYNEKGVPYETASGIKPIGLAEFLERAKALEQCICEWQPPSTKADDRFYTEDSQEGNKSVVHRTLEALHQSLLIYFYRMIYDVDAATLQGRVELVRDKLTENSQNDIGNPRYTAAFVWPGFIAASEALDPAVQASFAQWFEFNISSSGLQTYSTILQIVRQVWSMRRASKDNRTSWTDVLRQQNICMFWC